MSIEHDIRAAFEVMQRPHSLKIASDRGGYETLEAQQIEKWFGQLQWQQVTLPLLQTYRGDKTACLEFMSYSAFAYYYPAFMLICIADEFDRSELLIPVISSILPSERSIERFQAVQNDYSPVQKCCVGKFLSFAVKRANAFYGGLSDAAVLEMAEKTQVEWLRFCTNH